FTLILHCVVACASIAFNGLLLFCTFYRTPPSFRSYSLLLKLQASVDMTMSLSACTTMQRIVPCDYTLVYISYGPCTVMSSDVCYYLYTVLLASNVVSFATVLVAMGARFWILRFGAISKLRITTTLAIGAFIPALLFLVLFIMSRGDDRELRKILTRYHPNYLVDGLVITGNLDARTPSMLIVVGIIVLCPLPLFLIIWFYRICRFMILRLLRRKTKAMSIQTRVLHRQFVSALTAQAALPIFPLLGVGCSVLGMLGVIRDPALEITSILIAELPAFFSPIIVVMHIRYYSE
ncbi:hypothetical protein PFISCL1PPCAC_14073, partial [Pristionchus fissidentatus]